MRALLARLAGEYGRPHLEVGLVLIVACLSLTLLYYFGKPYRYPGVGHVLSQEGLAERRALAATAHAIAELDRENLSWVESYRTAERNPHRLMHEAYRWWAVACVLIYFLLPLSTALLLTRGRLSEISYMGLSPRGFWRHSWIYIVLFLLVSPAIVLVSFRSDFLKTYPFCVLAHRSLGDWLAFEVCYITQFLCLEIFFRGYLLFALERHLGRLAVFVMVVPYCMIHFGKPFLETLGAVVAGIVLGELALRLRSIWGGVVIHAAVALLMDVLALAQSGSLKRLLE